MNLRMSGWYGQAKPDEWKEWVGQPVHPAQIAAFLAAIRLKVEPDVEKLVGANARYEIDFESFGLDVFAPNIIVAFKWSYAPS